MWMTELRTGEFPFKWPKMAKTAPKSATRARFVCSDEKSGFENDTRDVANNPNDIEKSQKAVDKPRVSTSPACRRLRVAP